MGMAYREGEKSLSVDCEVFMTGRLEPGRRACGIPDRPERLPTTQRPILAVLF
jgi:hypothetical protein